MMRNRNILPLILMFMSLAACTYGLANGSLLSLPYPDPPPPDVLAAARARERVADMAALMGALGFIASLLWIVIRYRRNRAS